MIDLYYILQRSLFLHHYYHEISHYYIVPGCHYVLLQNHVFIHYYYIIKISLLHHYYIIMNLWQHYYIIITFTNITLLLHYYYRLLHFLVLHIITISLLRIITSLWRHYYVIIKLLLHDYYKGKILDKDLEISLSPAEDNRFAVT